MKALAWRACCEEEELVSQRGERQALAPWGRSVAPGDALGKGPAPAPGVWPVKGQLRNSFGETFLEKVEFPT